VTLPGAVLVLPGWRPRRKVEGRLAEVTLGVVVGTGLGLLTGFTGRGGGALVVPVLLLAGCDPRCAAATSAVIVALSSASALAGHLPAARFHPALTVACVAAVLLGSQLGSRAMARRVSRGSLRWGFGLLLVGVSAVLLVQALG